MSAPTPAAAGYGEATCWTGNLSLTKVLTWPFGANFSLASQAQPRTTAQTNLFAVIGFCLIGLACSLYASPSYLHFDEIAGLILHSSLG